MDRARDLHGRHHAITIMPHARERGNGHAESLTMHQAGHPERIEVEPRLKVGNVFAVRDAAIAGLGVARLPRVVAGAVAGQLQSVLEGWSLPSVPIRAAFPRARYLTPKVQTFIDLAVATMETGNTR